MKGLFKVVDQKVVTGYEFSDNILIGYAIRVLLNGEVEWVKYWERYDVGDNIYLCITCTPKDDDFKKVLNRAINSILINDKKEFIEMRKHLNKEFLNIAESLRIAKAEEWNF